MSGDYNARVRELFAAPQHAGDADGPVVDVARGGLRVVLGARVAGPRLQRLRFRVFGCPHMVAAAEAFCARYEGGPVAALRDYDARAALQEFEIPVEKTGRMLLLEDAIRALGDKLAACTDTCRD